MKAKILCRARSLYACSNWNMVPHEFYYSRWQFGEIRDMQLDALKLILGLAGHGDTEILNGGQRSQDRGFQMVS